MVWCFPCCKSSPTEESAQKDVELENNVQKAGLEVGGWNGLSRTSVKTPVKTTTAKTVATQPVNREQFQKQCLEKHNEYRTKHGVNPLKLNTELNTFAQEWADKLASTLTMIHRQPNKYGENLWMYMTTDKSHKVQGGDAVDSWYQDELPKYTFGTEPSNLDAGHLTQVLWAVSAELGVGVAKNGFYTFVVCNYNPPGNFLGEFVDNVPPVGGFTTKTVTNSSSTQSSSTTQHNGTAAASDSVTSDKFAQDILRAHNEYRAKHGSSPLVYDGKIAKFAQDWANHLAATGSFEHRSQSNPYGENIFWSSGTASAHKVVEAWYSEIKDYTNYTVDPFKTGAPFTSGHFTQVVWKSSEKLGCGVATDKKGGFTVVCNYSPQGNFIGQFTANVVPPKSARR